MTDVAAAPDTAVIESDSELLDYPFEQEPIDGDSADTSPDGNGDETGNDEARAAAHRAGMDRARLRKAVAKTVEVVNADAAVRERLAVLLNVDNDDVALSMAVLTADRAALADLDLLEEALTADGLGLGALVMQLVAEDRPKMRSLWSLARQFGADLPERPPAQQMKIVRALAGGIQAMGSGAARQIDAVRTLARKG